MERRYGAWAVDRPEPTLIRTFQDAEAAAATWLRYFGFADTQANTSGGPDGGVDVRSTDLVVQVKAEVAKVGRPVVQQIAGIASAESKQAVLFSLGGYTDEATEWASSADVALFSFDLSGEPVPENDRAIELTTQAADPDEVLARTLIQRSKPMDTQTILPILNGLQDAIESKRKLDTEWPDSTLARYESAASHYHLEEDLQTVSVIRAMKTSWDELVQSWLVELQWTAEQAKGLAMEIAEHLAGMHSRNSDLASVWDGRLTAEAERLQHLAVKLMGITDTESADRVAVSRFGFDPPGAVVGENGTARSLMGADKGAHTTANTPSAQEPARILTYQDRLAMRLTELSNLPEGAIATAEFTRPDGRKGSVVFVLRNIDQERTSPSVALGWMLKFRAEYTDAYNAARERYEELHKEYIDLSRIQDERHETFIKASDRLSSLRTEQSRLVFERSRRAQKMRRELERRIEEAEQVFDGARQDIEPVLENLHATQAALETARTEMDCVDVVTYGPHTNSHLVVRQASDWLKEVGIPLRSLTLRVSKYGADGVLQGFEDLTVEDVDEAN